MRKKYVIAMAVLGLLAAVAPQALAAAPDQKYQVSGELRTRWENLNNYEDFDDDNLDRRDFWPYRARVNIGATLAENIGIRFDVQSFGSWGNQDPFNGGISSGTPINQNEDADLQSQTSIYQAVVGLNKIGGSDLSVWVGRQEYNLGNGFILGNEEFYNGIAFDGVKGLYDFEKWDLTGFYYTSMERNDPTSSFTTTGVGTEDERFWGFVGSFTLGDKKKSDLDGYIMRHQELVTPTNTQAWIYGAHWRRMVKTRADAQAFGLDWNAELALETGENETTDPAIVGACAPGATCEQTFDFDGWAFEGDIGWNFVADSVIHRVHGGITALAGDDDLSNSDLEGWSGLFPSVHGRWGKADFFGDGTGFTFGGSPNTASGLTAYHLGYNLNAKDGKHNAFATFWTFMPTEDSVTDSGGTTVDVEDFGTEIDLGYKYGYSENATLGFVIAQLSPDDGLIPASGIPTTTDDTVTRFYGWLRVLFQ